MNGVEDLIIYKQYMELIYYTEMILVKYPKCERFEGMKYIILAYKEFKKEDKSNYLNKLDVNLKMLKVFIRISYKQKYISVKNYASWSKKLANIGNLLGGWMKNVQNNKKGV